MTVKTKYLAIVLLITAAVLLFSPLSAVEAAGPMGWDKVVHFCLFGLLLWSLAILLPKLPRLAVAGLTIVAGAATELIQGFVGRDPSWGDFFADTLGVSLALFLWAAWRGFRPRGALAAEGDAPKAVRIRAERLQHRPGEH